MYLQLCVKACICELTSPPLLNLFLHRNCICTNRKTYARRETVKLALKINFTAFPGNLLMKRQQEDNERKKDQTDGFL
jgi:hypothetical protein